MEMLGTQNSQNNIKKKNQVGELVVLHFEI